MTHKVQVKVKASNQIDEAIEACASCGLCQSVCPVYKSTRREELVARGKIKLLKGYNQGFLEDNKHLLEIISRCLLCGRCTDNCTNKVPAMEALRKAREELVEKTGLPFLKRILLNNTLPVSQRMDILAQAGRWGNPLLKGLVSAKSGLNLSLPVLNGLDRLPKVASQPFLKNVPEKITGPKNAPTVAFFVGCMSNYLRPELAFKAVHLLSRKYNVIVPKDQGCCGLPAISSGLTKVAKELTKRNLRSLLETKADMVVTACGSCAYALAKEIDRLSPLDLKEQAWRLSAKVYEISQILAEEKAFKPGFSFKNKVVAVHDPCHLKTGLKVSQEPRDLIAASGLDLVEMEEADACCGGGGLLPANEPELSQKILQPRLESFGASQADVLATSCSGCFAQWRRGLPLDIEVKHPIELVEFD